VNTRWIMLLVAAALHGLPMTASALDAARAGSENRRFSNAVTDGACESIKKKIERIDALLDDKPYGPQAEQLQRMKTRLQAQKRSLDCNQSIR